MVSSLAPQIQLGNEVHASKSIKPNYDLLNIVSQPSSSVKKPVQQTSDPFAALSLPVSRTASPFQFQQATSMAPLQSGALAGSGHITQPGRTPVNGLIQQVHRPQPSADEEWTFASALPDHATEISVTNSSISVTFLVSRSQQQSDVVLINSNISNNTPQAINDLTFQLAVTKVYTRHLQYQQRG